jgi:hypothetical protein
MSCREPKFTQLNGMGLSATLGRKLISVVDTLRDIPVRFGLRPYEVHIVRTRWTGGWRGQGQEVVISDTPILPTPLIQSLDGVQRITNIIGLDEVGTVKLDEVSGRYAEGFLSGTDSEGNPQDPDTNFFYEVQFPTPGTISDGAPRRRFFPSSAPSYDASKFAWSVTLTRSHADRLSNGDPAT